MPASPSIFSRPIPLPREKHEEAPTIYPVPLILEDMDGSLHRTRLVDLNSRGEFAITPWQQGEYRGIRVKGDIQSSPDGRRIVFVEWGEQNGQGTISVENPRGLELEVNLAKYLTVVDSERYSPETIAKATRKFTSYLDGNEYTWRYHSPENLEMEWECIDSSGETIAYWSLKLPFEPEYYSSGCSLTIVQQENDFLAIEMVSTCWIIRTFQKRYNDAVSAARAAKGEVETTEKSETEEEKAAARVAWENRWADCEDSDDSSPSSEDDDEVPESEYSATSPRETDS